MMEVDLPDVLFMISIVSALCCALVFAGCGWTPWRDIGSAAWRALCLLWRQGLLMAGALDQMLSTGANALLDWRPPRRSKTELERVIANWVADPRAAWESIDELECDVAAILRGGPDKITMAQLVAFAPSGLPAVPSDAPAIGGVRPSSPFSCPMLTGEVIKCEDCDGTGGAPYRLRSGDVRVYRCNRCRGHGAVIAH